MQKIAVFPDGRRLKLSPITCCEFLFMDSNWSGSQYESFQNFLAVNDYHIAEELDLNNEGGTIEVYDGEARLMWCVHGQEWVTTNDPPKGFPTDDMNALQQIAHGDDLFMPPPYPYQFVQNEELTYSNAKGVYDGWKYHEFSMLPLGHGPIMKGTLAGSVYLNDNLSATFNSYEVDGIEVHCVTDGFSVLESVSMDYPSGRLKFSWSDAVDPARVKVVVSYEYDYANESFTQYPQRHKCQQVVIE